MNHADPITGLWYARAWTGHAATTVVVDDPSAFTGARVVAECQDEATARLVAAAPVLQEALQRLERTFCRCFLNGSSESVDAARARWRRPQEGRRPDRYRIRCA